MDRFFGGLIGIFVIIAIVVVLIVYVVLPLAALIVGGVFLAGLLKGAFIAGKNFFEVLREGHQKLPYWGK